MLRGKDVRRLRMRKRHNLEPRMERCKEYLVAEPSARKGSWRNANQSLWLEIGCGKGSFTCAVAAAEPDCNLVAIEKVPDAMILAMERASAAKLKNVCFLDYDAAGLREIFAPGELDGIYINFCDPWPKSRDAKFRLTAPAFLRIYADLLPLGGEIRFKTDNAALFEWSLEQFYQEGWTLWKVTRDLHADGVTGILTDYERRFLEEGISIKRLVAVREKNTLDHNAGEPPRLRNAALSDARANQKEKQE